ncbi:CRISPR-associated endonuclease Cas2 [Anabaena cylindrica FACHB-243]|jgi:CRISPR-associated protein Cas2|uniref:CRISPR-associated endoribonuclease Cas2 n=1 Tax=Anabaena cylindrica (strain ATCC 27899 / PCC 7122) TaxID=272123 RepID=K9ZQJ6_ANACC|nr:MULTISPECIES: CRISPR-associated endonuclease Cas2 [Anabaena]AFZ61064.1 CRISPR-associated protein Cas2 [Anabaena cylindrica PCC 7122]MBD2421807.1 CRISPR-associated endonuclease Cas2 [Anabaena cylindrica FACHB-243]MBY5284591.1 CRISPR-associated endonuclease Cas2 [Anabaena sp. CCAP 1446/1C]MBY5306422.1 CRISPR-associated endonuclease Cas2 [Anabaena sp. CCAP 1446/1C]MCM2408064.1 CRISPR-associated endonuclease Cas2 [Anabaena sp. CCAP 1446/1C]
MFYLVCYDIVSDTRRNKVAKLLEAYGLRVQKSVFECVLDENQYTSLSKYLTRLVNKGEDQVRFYPMSAHTRCKIAVVGMQPEFVVDDAAFIV